MTDEEYHRYEAGRGQLAEQAQLACFEERQRCLHSKQQHGEIPFAERLGFQEAIVYYYWALMPMRDEASVANFWEEAELSEHLEETGLDAIKHLTGRVEMRQVQKDTVRGSWTEEQPVPAVLPFPVLLDISESLDEAASKLGFTPESGGDDVTETVSI